MQLRTVTIFGFVDASACLCNAFRAFIVSSVRPCGHGQPTLRSLRARIQNKEMPGLTSQAELFRDPISHPAPPLEALNTYLHYAVIYGQSPVGLPMPRLLKNARKEAWDDKCNRALQEIAWETVTRYPYSGVTAAPAKEK